MRDGSVSVRLSPEVKAAIDEIAHAGGRNRSSVVNELLTQAAKMRRVPGIVFIDEYQRREAKVAGTGLGVWEVIEGYQNVGEDWERFKRAYDWLSERQLRAALAYWQAYPQEIDAAIKENEEASDLEKLWAKYPYTRPLWRSTSEQSIDRAD